MLAATETACVHTRSVRMSWAQPLRRVVEIDLEHYPNCGGDFKIIAAILEALVIERNLTHLVRQARAPSRGHMRAHAASCLIAARRAVTGCARHG